MEASTQPATPAAPSLKDRLTPGVARAIAASLLIVAVVLIAGGWLFYVKPQNVEFAQRSQAHRSLMKLFDLQTAYHQVHGTFANNLDSLLAAAPDGPQVREQLKTCVDINTVAVVGDAERFKLEINVLDGRRTPMKIRGPALGPKPYIPPRPEKRPIAPDTKRLALAALIGIVVGTGAAAWQYLKPKRA